MKHSFTLLFLCICSFGFAQTADEEIEAILKLKPIEVPKYNFKEKEDIVAYATIFNSANFEDPAKIKELTNKVIIRIELIYTTYSERADFDQHGLNKKRLKTLFTLAPNTFKQPGIDWKLMAQTGCKSPAEGKDYFHGVLITFRDDVSAVKAAMEQAFMKEVFEGKVPSHAYKEYMTHEAKYYSTDSTGKVVVSKEPKTILPQFPGGERVRIDYFTKNLKQPSGGTSPEIVRVNFIVDKNGKVGKIGFPKGQDSPYAQEVKRFIQSMPNWKPGKLDGKETDCMVSMSIDFNGRGSIIPSPLEIYAANTAEYAEKEKEFDYMAVAAKSASKTVSYALGKVEYPSAVIVCDVTGSMAPFTAQMLEFISKAILDKDTSFLGVVVFNDGDNRPDKSKNIGKTGGVYEAPTANSEEVFETIMKGMTKGCGGDLPENNLEAVLQAEKSFPNCKSIVMIADNIATPRDMSLLSKVKTPIHVIVCGNTPELNEVYLDIAYQTKGSVFFNNQTIKDIHLFEEGGTVSVGKYIYVLVKGKFKQKRS